MVFMTDSERASEAASSTGLDVGLHVNFSEEFSVGFVPKSLRKAHDAVDRRLMRRHWVTDYFFSLSDHLALDRFERVICLATEAGVELMLHLQRPVDYAFLMRVVRRGWLRGAVRSSVG
jgi:hypothetical protein